MKKIVSILILLLVAALCGAARERVCIVTDRSAYLAGEQVWYSAFCVEGSTLSSSSSMAYIEVVSADGTGVVGKVALIGGRGCGKIDLPESMPTGNWKIIAYTAAGGVGDSSFEGAPTISVFNPRTTARSGGVSFAGDSYPEVTTEPTVSEKVRLLVNRTGHCGTMIPVGLENLTGDITVSVSISPVDGIAPPPSGTIADFLAVSDSSPAVAPFEVEGEVVEGYLADAFGNRVSADTLSAGAISSRGAISDCYYSHFRSDGSISFLTSNIYGNRDLFSEIHDCPEGVHMEIVDPFLHPSVSAPAPLLLSRAQRRSLLERMARQAAFFSSNPDTLVEFLPKREGLLIDERDAVVYNLDDYVRFPTMNEVLVEIIPELRFRKGPDGKHRLKLFRKDRTGTVMAYQDNVLVLLDGVVLTDHEKLYNLDAMQMKEIRFYANTYSVGDRTFNGIVHFITGRNALSAMKFGPEVRIIDFPGCSYPVAFGAKGQEWSLPLWQPMLSLPAGERSSFSLLLPSEPGTWRIRLEGMSLSGEPVIAESFITVR